jgi:hypothetical protein
VSKTEVPGGPVIGTDREIVGNAALRTVTLDLLPPGVVAGLDVQPVASSDPSHSADTTRNGRGIAFRFDGGGVSIVIQRWDGSAAVGVAGVDDLSQKAATTAREACAGSYQTFPAIECQQAREGWYEVAHPSQGDAVPDSYQETLVQLYMPDGYVVRVDAYNSPGEKAGPAATAAPVLTEAQALALARSPRWFAPK